jgi:hypothetical protein
LTPKVVSKPSFVVVRWVAQMPALLTRISRRVWAALKRSAKARMLSLLPRSRAIAFTSSRPVSRAISSRAASAFAMSRQARITVAPRRASPRAVSFPMPVLLPVTMQILPFRSSMVRDG